MGTALREFLPEDTQYYSRAEWDAREPAYGLPLLGVDTVIHCAALTDHQHPSAAELIETNILGTQRLADLLRKTGRRMVYLSTSYVYPGETGNYRESDPTRPIGAYAWSKFAGEAWVGTVPDQLIIRGSWYTPEKLAKMAHSALRDAWHSRETPREAARKIATLVLKGASGIYNIGGLRQTFYDLVFANGIIPNGIMRKDLNGKLPYPFPVDSSLNTERYDRFVDG